MTVYADAPEVEKIGQKLVNDNHPDLADCKIAYLFRDTAAKSKGRTIYGRARLIGGLTAFLAEPDAANSEEVDNFFLIEIAQDIWANLDTGQRRALVDHELCHCTIEHYSNGDPKLTVRGHDLEEFIVIVERHGLWMTDVEKFAKAASAQQLELREDDGE